VNPFEASPTPSAKSSDSESVELAAFDECLRRGQSPASADLGARADLRSPDPDSEKLADCLRLLERAWPRAAARAAGSDAPERVGRFEIERILGVGGFGTVYLARDPVLHRLIALKVPHPHVAARQGQESRLLREARAAAKLDHPHIVPVHEMVIGSGRDHIAQAYCPGPTLAEWLKARTSPVPPRLAASLIACLADAIQYSHDKGVLHRDVKPGNIILSPCSSDAPIAPDALPFHPRLTDFGLAKLLEDDPASVSLALGTPAYMAPEQAGPAPRDVGPACDIHALGAVLYELLVGRPPYVGDTAVEVLDAVRHRQPLPPRRLRPIVPRDLETICLKCLEKGPARRYAAARELADDLRRFLDGLAPRARRPGAAAIAWRAVRRRPVIAGLAAALFTAVVTFTSLLAVNNRRLTQLTGDLHASLENATRLQRDSDQLRIEAERAADLARERQQDAQAASERAEFHERAASRIAFASAVQLANLAWRDGDIRQCRTLLATAQEHLGAHDSPSLAWAFLDHRTREEGRAWGDGEGTMYCVAVATDGRRVAVGGHNGVVRIFDAHAGSIESTLRTDHADVRGMAFSRAADRLAVCGESTTVSVYDLATGDRLMVSPPAAGPLKAVVWLHDDQWIAAHGSFASIRLWNTIQSGTTVDLDTDDAVVSSLTATWDGRYVVAGSRDGSIRIWDAATRARIDHFGRHDDVVSCLAFSPDGRILAAGRNRHRIDFFKSSDHGFGFEGEIALTDDARGIAFSPTGDRLAVLEQFGTLRLWTIERTGEGPIEPRVVRGWLAHAERGSQVAFLPDGRRLVSVGRGPTSLVAWTLHPESGAAVLSESMPPEIHPDRGVLFEARQGRVIAAQPEPMVLSIDGLRPIARFGREPRERLAVSRDGAWLAASAMKDGERDTDEDLLEMWNMDSNGEEPPVWRRSEVAVNAMAFSPDTSLLAVVSWREDRVRLFRRDTGDELPALPARQCHQCVFSTDGRFLAVDALDDILIYDTSNGLPTQRLKGHLSTVLAIEFSPDGRWLASAGRDRVIHIWDATRWERVHTMSGHLFDIIQLCWTPDGRDLASLDVEHRVKIWDPIVGLGLGDLRTPRDGPAIRIAVSPDERFLLARLQSGAIERQRLRADSPNPSYAVESIE